MKYSELLRPQIHYSPEKNWINDPNGCVFFKGRYQLFYQYHPFSSTWGPMHWGHAESTDLIHWKEKRIALFPDDKLGMALLYYKFFNCAQAFDSFSIEYDVLSHATGSEACEL